MTRDDGQGSESSEPSAWPWAWLSVCTLGTPPRTPRIAPSGSAGSALPAPYPSLGRYLAVSLAVGCSDQRGTERGLAGLRAWLGGRAAMVPPPIGNLC